MKFILSCVLVLQIMFASAMGHLKEKMYTLTYQKVTHTIDKTVLACLPVLRDMVAAMNQEETIALPDMDGISSNDFKTFMRLMEIFAEYQHDARLLERSLKQMSGGLSPVELEAVTTLANFFNVPELASFLVEALKQHPHFVDAFEQGSLGRGADDIAQQFLPDSLHVDPSPIVYHETWLQGVSADGQYQLALVNNCHAVDKVSNTTLFGIKKNELIGSGNGVFSPDSSIVALLSSGCVAFFDVAQKKCIYRETFPGQHIFPVRGVFSVDGSYFILHDGRDVGVTVYDLRTRTVCKNDIQVSWPTMALAISESKKAVVATFPPDGASGSIVVIDAVTGAKESEIPVSDMPSLLALSPRGTYAAICCEERVAVITTRTGETICTANCRAPAHAVFNNDETMLAIIGSEYGRDVDLSIYAVPTGTLLDSVQNDARRIVTHLPLFCTTQDRLFMNVGSGVFAHWDYHVPPRMLFERSGIALTYKQALFFYWIAARRAREKSRITVPTPYVADIAASFTPRITEFLADFVEPAMADSTAKRHNH